LVHGERRQLVEQVGVVDAEDHLARVVADESVDDFAYPTEGVWAEVAGDRGEGAQWDRASGCGADDPLSSCGARPAGVDGFARYASLADTGVAGQHDPARAITGCANGVGDDSEFLRSPNQGPLGDHVQILTARQFAARGFAGRRAQLRVSHLHERGERVEFHPDAVGDHLVGDPRIAQPQRGRIRQRQLL